MDRNIKKTIAIALFLPCFLITSGYAQSSLKNKESFLEAESDFLYEDFAEALPVYIKLKEQYPLNHNLDYKIGRCYLNMTYEKKKAIQYLEIAIKNISLTYKDGNYKETMAPVDALFYLADAYRVNIQLDKAIETYKQFKSKCPPENYDIRLVDLQIAACKRAKEAMKSPIDYDEQNLGNIVNTRYSETNPVVSQDESTLVYASKLPFYQAMFYSKKINGKWQNPINMIPELGVDDDCFPTSISYDGNELYIYRSNEYKGDLFVSYYENGKWSKIKKLNNNINTKYWESHASLSRDGKSLYFTSNREGGFGGLDIYVSQRKSGDDWGPAKNLGATINTPYNEETPFIMPDGKKLYFSSFTHETIGGYDIFYSYLNSKGMWSKPVNIGYPINTTDDDYFFCPLRDGKIAYISRFDPNGAGQFDITRLNIFSNENPRKYQVKGVVKVPQNMPKQQPFVLALYDKLKKDTVFKKTYTETDNITFEAIPGQYEVHVSSNGYEHKNVPFAINYGSKDLNPDIQINLSQIQSKPEASKIEQPKTLIAANSQSEKENLLSGENGELDQINTTTAETPNNIDTSTIADTDSIIKQTQVTDTTKLAPDNLPINTDEGIKKSNLLYKFLHSPAMISSVAIVVVIIFLFIIVLLIRKRKKTNQ